MTDVLIKTMWRYTDIGGSMLYADGSMDEVCFCKMRNTMDCRQPPEAKTVVPSESPERTKLDNFLVLDFGISGLWESNFLLS